MYTNSNKIVRLIERKNMVFALEFLFVKFFFEAEGIFLLSMGLDSIEFLNNLM